MPQREPKVSVVTVCYNTVDSIERTILSILDQTYHNIEYIIIDGGSTDGTVDIIQRYADRISYWVSEPDKGIYDAMNKGIAVATGDYINFMNAGDCFFSHSIIEAVVYNINRTAVYYGDVVMCDAKNNCFFYGGKFNRYRIAITNICHQGIFYPLSLLKEHQYDLSYPVLADWHTNQSLWKYTSFQHINLITAKFSLGGLSSSSIKDIAFYKNRISHLAKSLGIIATIYYIFRRTCSTLKQALIQKHIDNRRKPPVI